MWAPKHAQPAAAAAPRKPVSGRNMGLLVPPPARPTRHKPMVESPQHGHVLTVKARASLWAWGSEAETGTPSEESKRPQSSCHGQAGFEGAVCKGAKTGRTGPQALPRSLQCLTLPKVTSPQRCRDSCSQGEADPRPALPASHSKAEGSPGAA